MESMTPEQKVQALNEARQLAVERLRQEAVSAHFAGDAAAVNHCCAVAISHLSTWSKEGVQGPSDWMRRMRWACVLSIYWLTDDYMRGFAEESFKSLARGISPDDPLAATLRTAFFLAEQSLIGPRASLESLRELPTDWIQEEGALEDTLLLQLCLEMAFVWNPWDDSWLETGERWCNRIPDTVASQIRHVLTRLKTQRCLLYPSPNHPPKRLAISSIPTAYKDLVFAILALLDCDDNSLPSAVRRIAQRNTFGSEGTLHFNDLVRASMFSLPQLDAQEVRLTRQRLLEFRNNSRSPAWIENVRSRSFDQKMCKILREPVKVSASNRFDCFRLARMDEISALRSWNLFGWTHAMSQHAVASEELSRWGNSKVSEQKTEYQRFARDAFYYLVLAGNLGENDIGHQRLIPQIENSTNEERAALVRTLLHARPFAWYRVVVALKMLSDAIPVSVLSEVARWSVRYYDAQSRGIELRGFNLYWFSFWGDILGVSGIDRRLCKILTPIFLQVSANPMLWRAPNDPLGQYLSYAPLDDVRECLLQMTQVPLQNDSDDHARRWTMVHRIVSRRQALYPLFQKWLASSCTLALGICHSSDPKLQSSASQEPESWKWIRGQIADWIAVMEQRPRTQFGGGPLSRELVRMLPWSEDTRETVSRILSVVTDENTPRNDVVSCLALLEAFLAANPIACAPILRDSILSLFDKPLRWNNDFPGAGSGPLDTFRYDGPEKADILYWLLRIGARLVVADSGSSASVFANWVRENFHQLPPVCMGPMVNLSGTLVNCGCHISTSEFGLLWQHAIQQCLDGAMDGKAEDNSAAVLLLEATRLLEPSNDIDYGGTGVSVKTAESLAQIIARQLRLFASHPNFQTRVNLAVAIRYCRKTLSDAAPLDLSGIQEELKKDSRARVRFHASA